MKIGVFDSGLGGLIMTRAIRDTLTDYDIVYLGDTLHVPYGRRSQDTVFKLTRDAVRYLFETHDCQIIIIACNTASARALRRIQQTWLPHYFPNRRVLGVVVPTLEAARDLNHKNIGVIGTESIINSNIYTEELHKIDQRITIHNQATPLLVPLIENAGLRYIDPILRDYLKPLQKQNIQSLILGCTHYAQIAPQIQKILGDQTSLITQTDIIPQSLRQYLDRHPEHREKLSKTGTTQFYVTDLTPGYIETAHTAYGGKINITQANYHSSDHAQIERQAS